MNKAEEILEKYTLWQGEKAVRTEEDMLLAMEEYVEWKLKNCNLQSVSNNEVAVCDHPQIYEIGNGWKYCPKCNCRILHVKAGIKSADLSSMDEVN